MSFSPLPYDIRWTCKLIRRDVKALKAKLQTKLKTKLKTTLSESTKTAALAYQQDEIDTIIIEREDSQDTEAVSTREDASTVRDALEERLKGVYASRDINMSHEDRWEFRGSWLLLYTAMCVSEMPVDEYAGAAGSLNRFDSVFSTCSKPDPPPKHIWHDILEATTSASKITSTAEDILGYIWPKKDKAEILNQIGNPTKRLHEVEDNELREKLRGLLKGC